MIKKLLAMTLLSGLATVLLLAGCKSNTSPEVSSTSNSATGTALIDYQIVLGNDKVADKFGGLIGLPTSVIYSRDGKKIKTVIGSIMTDPKSLSNLIETELAKQEDATQTPAPEAATVLPAIDGTNVSVAQFKGKVVLVNFWATWCEPCKAEIPWLIESNQKYSSKGLVILGVAMDDEGKKVVEPWVKSQHFDVTGS
jgi:thiol-disulfide isomerase/thioredoxin